MNFGYQLLEGSQPLKINCFQRSTKKYFNRNVLSLLKVFQLCQRQQIAPRHHTCKRTNNSSFKEFQLYFYSQHLSIKTASLSWEKRGEKLSLFTYVGGEAGWITTCQNICQQDNRAIFYIQKISSTQPCQIQYSLISLQICSACYVMLSKYLFKSANIYQSYKKTAW